MVAPINVPTDTLVSVRMIVLFAIIKNGWYHVINVPELVQTNSGTFFVKGVIDMSKLIANVSNVPELLKQVKADGFYLAGSDLAWQLLGSHEEGLLSASEYAKFFAYLRAQTRKTLFADGQSGFGNPLNAYFTTKEFEYYGADVILINDQKYPSKTAQPQADDLYSFAGRLKSALDAHHQSDSKVWAKLDGFEQYGLTGLKKRLALAEKLGADGALLNHVPAKANNQLSTKLPLGILNGDNSEDYKQIEYNFE